MAAQLFQKPILYRFATSMSNPESRYMRCRVKPGLTEQSVLQLSHFLLLSAITRILCCHAGLDPASHFSVVNFFKSPYPYFFLKKMRTGTPVRSKCSRI